MLRIILGFIASVMLSSAFGQSIYSITFRVEDRLNGGVTFERHEFDRVRKVMTAFDSLSNQPIMSAADYNNGHTTVVTTRGSRVTIESDRNPETMRPGEEAFGTVFIQTHNMPPATLSLHAKVTKQGNLTVLETTAAGHGYVMRARMAYATDYYRPEWQENITLINGQKVRHDYLVPIR